jgi:hypothetical protein
VSKRFALPDDSPAPPEVVAAGPVFESVWRELARGVRYRDAGAAVGLDKDGVWRLVNSRRDLFRDVDTRLRPLQTAAEQMLERVLERGLDPEASEADVASGMRAAAVVLQRVSSAERIRSLDGPAKTGVRKPSAGSAPGAPPRPDAVPAAVTEGEAPPRPRLVPLPPVSTTQPVRSVPSSRRQVGG